MHRQVVEPPYRSANANRAAERVAVALPARLTWKDQQGAVRFATVMTRNVSELGAYVECSCPVSLSLYRLVQFQLEREVKGDAHLPETLKQGRLTAAVYRVQPPDARGRGQGFALRLMVDPKRRASITEPSLPLRVRATA